MLRARYRRIVFFFARLLFSFAWWDLLLPRLGLRSMAQRTRSKRLQEAAGSFRGLAIQMGGVLIKVGQFLSTRVDVLPPEVTDELAGLQDEVPPVDFSAIRALAESDLGAPLEEKFSWFDPAPLAAASLGQVHRAHLLLKPAATDTVELTASDVVVKIQRPGIEQLIRTDLAALDTVGGWLQRYPPIGRRADVPALLAEFSRILYQEVDYLAEGRNAETFAANFKHNAGVRVPQVIWSHTTRHVLTLENVLAIKITDYAGITAAGLQRAEVAERLLDTYLQQIFEDGFFHADPHPGNLFVCPMPPGAGEGGPAWKLTFVDFGMVGHVPNNLRQGLREMLIGVGTQDAARVVHSYQMLGILLPGADLDLLEKAGVRMFERFWGKNMNELREITPQEVNDLLHEFRQLLYSLPFQVPHDLIFLGRAVGILSGMCTGLDPEFNVWDHLAPYANKLIAAEVKSGAGTWLKELELLARSLFVLPHKMDQVLSKLEHGELAVRTPEVSFQVNRLERALYGLASSIIFATLWVSGVQLYLARFETWAVIVLCVAGFGFLWLVFNQRLSH